MEKRFCYNPFTNNLITCSQSHSIGLYNKGQGKNFDSFIRGIIFDDTLYLRTFYPFDDIDDLNYTELNKKSISLLNQFKTDILETIKKEYSIIPKTIIFNADNDLLKGKLINV